MTSEATPSPSPTPFQSFMSSLNWGQKPANYTPNAETNRASTGGGWGWNWGQQPANDPTNAPANAETNRSSTASWGWNWGQQTASQPANADTSRASTASWGWNWGQQPATPEAPQNDSKGGGFLGLGNRETTAKATPEPTRPPNRSTMEGMIWNANEVLDIAMSPEGVPPGLFRKCQGIILISVVEVGIVLSGAMGTGILMAKKADGTWSSPSACGLTGLSLGFMFGGSNKNIIVFLMTDSAVRNAASDKGFKLGGQAELALGPVGRSFQGNIGFGQSGKIDSTIALGFSRGLFLGASVGGAVVGARQKTNAAFYGRELTAPGILFEDVRMPEGKATVIDEVYTKLKRLAPVS